MRIILKFLLFGNRKEKKNQERLKSCMSYPDRLLQPSGYCVDGDIL